MNSGRLALSLIAELFWVLLFFIHFQWRCFDCRDYITSN